MCPTNQSKKCFFYADRNVKLFFQCVSLEKMEKSPKVTMTLVVFWWWGGACSAHAQWGAMWAGSCSLTRTQNLRFCGNQKQTIIGQQIKQSTENGYSDVLVVVVIIRLPKQG